MENGENYISAGSGDDDRKFAIVSQLSAPSHVEASGTNSCDSNHIVSDDGVNVQEVCNTCETPTTDRNIFRLRKCFTKTVGLSPVSEISAALQDSGLDTPRASRRDKFEMHCLKKVPEGELHRKADESRPRTPSTVRASNEERLPYHCERFQNLDYVGGDTKDNDTNQWHQQLQQEEEENGAASNRTSRFTLNSASRSPASRRMEQRQRSLQFRQHGLPQRIIYDDGCKLLASPGKENLPTEELSFYQCHSPQQSPRPCSPCTLCPDDGELLPSENNTPSKHMPIPTIGSKAGPLVAGKLVAGSLGYRLRRPLDDHDPNSMDSGYGASVVLNDVLMSSLQGSNASGGSAAGAKTMFPFSTTASISRHSTISPARRITLHSSLSSGSMESMDDMELFDMEAMEDDEDETGKTQSYQLAQLQQQQQQQQPQGTTLMPSGLNSLICGTIKTTRTATTPEQKRPFVRRCLSLTENNTTPSLHLLPHQMKTPERYVRRTIAMDDQENCNLTPYSSRTVASDVTRCFKRPEPPGVSPVQSKRSKITPQLDGAAAETVMATGVSALDSPARTTVLVPKKTVYQKSISMNDAQIMSALSRSSSEPDLIGDFSKSYVLPLMDGQHRDLKSISGDTMARLVRGDYNDKIASFKIIDCRYPYEFEGGHIRGAKNLYTQEQIIEELIKSKTEPPTVAAAASGTQDGTMRRHIIVFHCEFSSERGPKLSRFLRNHDRILNADSYPALHYPEMYLLHGGYKEFFKAHAELCDPIAYRPMLDPDFGDAYRHFRAKSRSWNGDGTGTVKASDKSGGGPLPGGGPSRLTKSRSRLML